MVNIVAQTFADSTAANGQGMGESMSRFLEEMRGPALEMAKLYLGQAALTFAYIYSLACVGERMAASLRKELFASILRQDVAFFDEHKSGEIVSRLTSDIQAGILFSAPRFQKRQFCYPMRTVTLKMH